MINDFFLNYFFIIISSLCVILTFNILLKFKETKQFFPWLLIVLSFVFDLIPNLLWIPLVNYFGGISRVPQPSILDSMWLLSYFLLGFGVILYWSNLFKKVNLSRVVDLNVIILISALSFFLSTPLLSFQGVAFNSLIQPLYISFSVFSFLSCLPLLRLFFGGKLSTDWFLIALGGISYTLAEIISLIESAIYSYFFVSNSFLLIGYFLFVISFSRIASIK